MTDIVIGNSKGLELFVRDEDDDGTFDEGERIGVRGVPGDRFEETRVTELLGRVGIGELRPGARLQRIGAYMDYFREAERLTNAGDYLAAGAQLRQAEDFARDNGITVDRNRLAEIRWRAVDVAIEAYDSGFNGLSLKDIDTLSRDDNAVDSAHSAGLILEYLSARSSLESVSDSAGPARDRVLGEIAERAGDLRTDIAERGRRMRFILESGSRTTVADQTSASGTVIRVGDRVRYRDPESGESWASPFIVTGFEVHASRVVVWGRELTPSMESDTERSAELDYLEVLPPEERGMSRESPVSPDEASNPMDRLLTRVGRGWDHFRSLFTL